MLNKEFKLLIICNQILANNALISEHERCNPFWEKIIKIEGNGYSYNLNDNLFKASIKDDGKKLFDFLSSEARGDKKIYLIVYDEREISDAINDSYKQITVKNDAQCYDFIYSMENCTFLPLTVYKFV